VRRLVHVAGDSDQLGWSPRRSRPHPTWGLAQVRCAALSWLNMLLPAPGVRGFRVERAEVAWTRIQWP
jgi:hypothetical protein